MLGVGDGSRRLHLPACRSLRQFVRRRRATCRAVAVAATVVELVRSGWDGAGFGRCCGYWLCLEGRLQRCGGCWPYLSGQDRFRTIRRVLPCRGWDQFRLVQGGLFAGGGCGWSGDHRTAPPGLGSDRAGAAPCACAPRRPGQSGMGRGRVFAPVRRGWGGRGGCGAIALSSWTEADSGPKRASVRSRFSSPAHYFLP